MARKQTIRCEIPVEVEAKLNLVGAYLTVLKPDTAPKTRSQTLKAAIEYALGKLTEEIQIYVPD